MANRLLSGNGARLYSHLYVRARRPSGQLDVRSCEVATALERSRRSIGDGFAELKEKGVCRVNFSVNQHSAVHIEICDPFWPFVKDGAATRDAAMEYVSQVQNLLYGRACVVRDFGPADEKFARDLFANGVLIEVVDRAIRLGCARKYRSLLNGMENKPIRRLGYFREPIEEVGSEDPRYWDRSVDLQLKKMEDRWRKEQEAALPNSAQARREYKNQTG